MTLREQPVNVVSIMGHDYSLKAPPGQEQTLEQAAAMLNASLADTKRRYPMLLGDKLLVLAALNLCSQHIEQARAHEQVLQHTQAKVDATVSAIARTLDDVAV